MEWLTNEILTGFQKLLCLGLERTPATDLIPGTVAAWREALGPHWDQGRDTPRIREAFVLLARTRRSWPAPADFLEFLPRIRHELRALPAKPADPDRVRKILEDVAKELRA